MLLCAGVCAGERAKQGKSREKVVENISVAQRSVLFSSNLGVVLVDQHRRQKKLHIALLGRKKYLNYNLNIRLSTIRLKFECCPASVV